MNTPSQQLNILTQAIIGGVVGMLFNQTQRQQLFLSHIPFKSSLFVLLGLGRPFFIPPGVQPLMALRNKKPGQIMTLAGGAL